MDKQSTSYVFVKVFLRLFTLSSITHLSSGLQESCKPNTKQYIRVKVNDVILHGLWNNCNLYRDIKTLWLSMKLTPNEDFHCYSYKWYKGQILTAKAKENYLTKTKKLLNKLRIIWFFSDERASNKTSCTTLRTTDDLPTIHVMFHVSRNQVLPKCDGLWVCL